MRNSYVDGLETVFDHAPRLMPAGGVDVSGGGRWRIWEKAGTKTDAPILGNGDMLAAFAGEAHECQFWLTTNDFWYMQSNPNYAFFHDNAVARRDPAVSLGSPRTLGRVIFDMPLLKSASYKVTQTFSDAVTRARFELENGRRVEMEAFVAAGENVLAVKFTASFDCPVTVRFLFPNEKGYGCDIAVDNMGDCEDDEILSGTFAGLTGDRPLQIRNETRGLIWGVREFSQGCDVPAKLGFGLKMLGADSVQTVLKSGKSAYFAACLRSWDKTARPMEYARGRAKSMTSDELKALYAAHARWWREYWDISGIKLNDALLMKNYYLSMYMLGSLSRDRDYPPNILGICTFDRMAWNGNYKINYNHQTPYLGLLAAGRFEQSDPHDAPYLAMLDVGREMSKRLLGHPGVYLPLGLGPKGMVSEALLLHMKSPAVHGALNMLMRWRLSMDDKYLSNVYPFLREVAIFWEHDLVKRDGVYHIVDDGMHERVTRDVTAHGCPEDPTNTLGYLKSFFYDMLYASEALGLDADRRPKWRDILQNLAPYSVGTIDEISDNPTLWNEAGETLDSLIPERLRSVPVYYNEGRGSRWSKHFPGNIMHIYPGGAIGLSSPESELETAKNTILALSEMEHSLRRKNACSGEVSIGGAWNATNLGCLFFPAAVRVGVDAELILTELREKLALTALPNGFVDGNPHGIENLSTVPNTLQEMLLISHQGLIRVFPVWPARSLPEAEFYGLRAYGGFIVSGRMRNGEVNTFTVKSTASERLRVLNPWPLSPMRVNGAVFEGEVFETETCPGQEFSFTRG